eukprot:253859-Prymnesium_polylepis.1
MSLPPFGARSGRPRVPSRRRRPPFRRRARAAASARPIDILRDDRIHTTQSVIVTLCPRASLRLAEPHEASAIACGRWSA